MKRLIKVVLVIMLVVVLIPLGSGALRKYGPYSKSEEIRSPDGKYYACVGYQGFMDSVHSAVYIRDKNNSKRCAVKDIPRIDEVLWWSSDSRRVAGAYADPGHSYLYMFVYDVPSGHSAQTTIRVEANKQTDPVHTQVAGIAWEWQDKDSIAVIVMCESEDKSAVEYPVAVVNVVDGKDSMKLVRKR